MIYPGTLLVNNDYVQLILSVENEENPHLCKVTVFASNKKNKKVTTYRYLRKDAMILNSEVKTMFSSHAFQHE